jgi:hypothetical protein
LDQKKNTGTKGLALASVALIATAILSFVISIVITECLGYDRLWVWIGQCLDLALCFAALLCSSLAVFKSHRVQPRDESALAVLYVLVGICLFMYFLAWVGVFANGGVLFLGMGER